MKKGLLWGIIVISAMMLTGCYRDEIDGIQDDLKDVILRVDALEKWQKEVNSNISALQAIVSALETKDYVTSVSPLADGSGYEITFQNSGKVTIYHGKD